MGDNFRPVVLQQQTPFQSTLTTTLSLPLASAPQPLLGSVLPYSTDRISRSIDKSHDQGTLSQETSRKKIQELKRLLYRYPIFSNPDGRYHIHVFSLYVTYCKYLQIFAP
jgi:hypothetical protein